ncbi:unnamed protein product, partial [marine sediment metagenome]
AIMGSYVIIFSIVGIYWIWEIIVKQNNFTLTKIPYWKYWVVPFALLSFWSPVELEFKPIYLLTSDYGIAFCFTAPVILAILSLYHPQVNMAVLRVTSFVGLFVGIFSYINNWFEKINYRKARFWLVVLIITILAWPVIIFFSGAFEGADITILAGGFYWQAFLYALWE